MKAQMDFSLYPDIHGKFTVPGQTLAFGGRFVPEALIPALEELEQAYSAIRLDPDFQSELNETFRQYAGRPTPLTFAERLSNQIGAQIFLKREDLAHTGAHKIN